MSDDWEREREVPLPAGVADPRPALVEKLRAVVRHGLARVGQVFNVSEEEAAGLIGHELGLPGCQILSWSRNVPLGAPVDALWCPAVQAAENSTRKDVANGGRRA